MKTEQRFYLIQMEEVANFDYLAKASDSFIMRIAEQLGTVYSLDGFIEAFNEPSISAETMYLRVINAPSNEND